MSDAIQNSLFPIDSRMLDLLAGQISNFPNLYEFATNMIATPAELLTPEGMDLVSSFTDRESIRVEEAMCFLDTISFLEIFYFNSSGGFLTDRLLTSLAKNRNIKYTSEVNPSVDPMGALLGRKFYQDADDTSFNVVKELSEEPIYLSVFTYSMLVFILEIGLNETTE